MWLPEQMSEASTPCPSATLYWRPGCPFCMNLRLGLLLRRVDINQVNIWKDPDAAALVRSVADGNETVPTVVIEGEAMVNPTPGQVASALRSRR